MYSLLEKDRGEAINQMVSVPHWLKVAWGQVLITPIGLWVQQMHRSGRLQWLLGLAGRKQR